MKNSRVPSFLVGLVVVCGGFIGRCAPGRAEVVPKIPIMAYPFDLKDVRLLPSPFLHAMQKDAEYLLSLDVDRLLHVFRVNAGIPSSATPLGGWERPDCELRGHFVGHYLSACSMMFASTGDGRFKERVDRVVAGLAECQEKLPNGYLSAFPEEFFDRVETTGRVWAPYYTLHKILAGLLDAHLYCQNAQALEVAKKLGDWVIARNQRLSDEQMQRMLNVEHGGMNEALANLFAITGEERYLRIAERFNHLAVLQPLSRGQDVLTGLHANTQIPKFTGAARLFELTGQGWYRDAALNFWTVVVKERSYVIGGNSDNEHFTPKERLSEALGPNTTETCNTYNMLKLTRHLMQWDLSAEYADYYERALYNHILGSQNPETGMMCYYVPLRPGSRKTYSTPLDSFWCCTGTGIENHAKYGDSIYFHDGKETVFVNLFIPSELRWQSKGITLRQEMAFPDASEVRLNIDVRSPIELTIAIRWPSWCSAGFTITVNGQSHQPSGNPGQYIPVRRVWKSGDTVVINLPMSLSVEAFRDNPKRFAFLYGPLVLAAVLPDESASPARSGMAARAKAQRPQIPMPGIPVVVAEHLDLGRFEPVENKPGHWRAPAGLFQTIDQGEYPELILEPFFRIHGSRRYVVYFDRIDPGEWQNLVAEYEKMRKRWEALEKRTIDRVEIGVPESEKLHDLFGDRTESGVFSGRRWRHAVNGGWFSYRLKVPQGEPVAILVEYWGSDVGNRVFDILVGEHKLATERLANNRPGEFYIELYRVPPELLKNRQDIVVRFQAHPGAIAGGIFDLRTVTLEE